MATDLDSTGFLDTTNASDRRSIQNRRLLKSLQLFNLNMNFWRRSDINANSNAEGGDQPTQVEKVSVRSCAANAVLSISELKD